MWRWRVHGKGLNNDVGLFVGAVFVYLGHGEVSEFLVLVLALARPFLLAGIRVISTVTESFLLPPQPPATPPGSPRTARPRLISETIVAVVVHVTPVVFEGIAQNSAGLLRRAGVIILGLALDLRRLR